MLQLVSQKMICSGGRVRCSVWPRRSTRVSREVACAVGTVNSRSSWAARKVGDPGEADLLLRQLMNTMRAVHDAQAASGQARQARQMSEMVRGKLQQVVRDLPDIDHLVRRLDREPGSTHLPN